MSFVGGQYGPTDEVKGNIRAGMTEMSGIVHSWAACVP